MKYCRKTSLGDRLLSNAVVLSHRKAVPVCTSLASKKGISWRAAFDSGQILLLFLLPNPPWVILLDEGLQCWATSSVAQPCEREVPHSECRSGDRSRFLVRSWRQTAFHITVTGAIIGKQTVPWKIRSRKGKSPNEVKSWTLSLTGEKRFLDMHSEMSV